MILKDMVKLNRLLGSMSIEELERYTSLLLERSTSLDSTLTEAEAVKLTTALSKKGEVIANFIGEYCNTLDTWAHTYWLGKQVVKAPTDLWVYQEIISETKPEVIIETGTNGSGSAYFFLTVCEMLKIDCQILTVDIDRYTHLEVNDPRITYFYGDSLDQGISKAIRELASSKRTMLSLDSLHTYDQVKGELDRYGDLTSVGCYLVVEDTGAPEALRAAIEYVDNSNGSFEVDRFRERYMMTSNPGGWLKRVE